MSAKEDRDAAAMDLLARLYRDDDDAAAIAPPPAAPAESFTRMSELRSVFADMKRDMAEPSNAGMAALMTAAARNVDGMAGARKADRDRSRLSATEKPTVGQRLRRWLGAFAAHPGLIAATSVVLVAGVAGVMYVRKGSIDGGAATELTQPKEDSDGKLVVPKADSGGKLVVPTVPGKAEDAIPVQLESKNGDSIAPLPAEPTKPPAVVNPVSSSQRKEKTTTTGGKTFDSVKQTTRSTKSKNADPSFVDQNVSGSGRSANGNEAQSDLGEALAGSPGSASAAGPEPLLSAKDGDANVNVATTKNGKGKSIAKDRVAAAKEQLNLAEKAAQKGDCSKARSLAEQARLNDKRQYDQAINARNSGNLPQCYSVSE